jgi:hypothetical protein
VVATLGYSRNITYCLTAPPYILCCIVIILNGLHSDKVQERFLHVLCPLAITIVANVIAVATTKTAPRYVAMMLMPASCKSTQPDCAVTPLLLTSYPGITLQTTLRKRQHAQVSVKCMQADLAAAFRSSTVTVSWITGATNGPRIKRAIVLATVNAVVNTPNIWTVRAL